MMRIFLKTRGLLVLPVLAILLLAACGGDNGGSSTDGAGGGPAATKVTIEDFAFSPKKVTVEAGATVTWTNNDSNAHDVTSTDGPELDAAETSAFVSGNMDQGDTFSHTFTKPGTYYYECNLHKTVPTMHASVVVK